MPEILPLNCDDCGEDLPYPDIHYCSCGARVCSSCYRDNHAVHDQPAKQPSHFVDFYGIEASL